MLARIEGSHLTSAFYLASVPTWLYGQIVELPEVQALRDLVTDDPDATEALAQRTIELFDVPPEPGYRTDHESALCCYAYVLAQLDDDNARRALEYMAANVRAAHGWLGLLMPRYLEDAAARRSPEPEPVT